VGSEALEVETERLPTRRGLNILVVDDDFEFLVSLREVLDLDGHRTRVATLGSQALAIAREFKLRNEPIELSILDYNVPDLSGLETFEHLIMELPAMGAIFVTADGSAGLEQRLLRAGAFAFVRKPLRVQELRAAVTTFQRSWSRGRAR
jgi:DNA-binding response OmpR family regulator